MRKRSLLLILVLIIGHYSSFASGPFTKNCDFGADGIYYRITSSNTVAVTPQKETYFKCTEDEVSYICRRIFECGHSGKVVIPETVSYNGTTYTVSSIDEYSFLNGTWDIDDDDSFTSEVTSVIVPGTIKTLRNTFWQCSELTQVILKEGVETLYEGSFYDCQLLTSIHLPSSIKSLLPHYGGGSSWYGVIMNCPNLKSIKVHWTSPLAISAHVFEGLDLSKITLSVPINCKSAYENAAVWQDFKEIVERAAYVTDQTSGLTGETGIVAFTCPEVGTLYDAWVEAGHPNKIKVSGNVNRNDLYRVTHTSYPSYHILYIDLSDAHINACTSDDYSHESCKENYLSGLWLGYDDDSGNFWPNILVLPDDLEELYLNGEYYGSGIRKIYSKQSTPCKTTLNYNCSFYVPSGSRLAWKAKTTSPNYVTFIDGPEKTINVQAAGTLQNYLTADEIETINLLTVNGTIDARDFKTIKKMTNLVTLNIFAKIAAYEGYYGPNPSQISYKAREIPAYLFQNHQNLESVQLSAMETGYIIGDHAFDGCTNLSSFNENHYGVISLGDFCFRNTAVHNTILLLGKTGRRYEDDNYVSFWNLTEELNHVGKNPFFGSKVWFSNGYCDSAQNNYDSNTDYYYNITDYCVLPDYFDYNYPQGFYRHPYVELLSKDKSILYVVRAIDNHNLILTENVNTLADFAISGLNISSVDLKSVSQIGDGFLYQCPLLTEIKCDNESFTAVDGVLFTKDKTTLVKYPCAKEGAAYTIPSTVTTISKWAFEGAGHLNTMILEPLTPPMVEDLAFENIDVAQISIFVPQGCKASYEALDCWQQFKEIVEIGTSEIDVTDVSQIDNVVYIEPLEAKKGETELELSIKMKNSASIRGFQFDLELPEGVTPVTSGTSIFRRLNNSRFPKDDFDERYHTLNISLQSDGSYRFLCGSTQDQTFIGNDGEIIMLKVNIDENIAEGDHAIILKNIKLTETDINNYYETERVVSKITVLNYETGDISGDGVVDVSDYIGVANHILGNTPSGFNAKAADVNKDNAIDVSDYIGIANIILTGSIYGNSNNAAPRFEEDEELDPQ